MPYPTPPRRFSFVLLILFFGLGLLALRLHLLSGDGPMLLLAAVSGVLSVGLAVSIVLANRVQLTVGHS